MSLDLLMNLQQETRRLFIAGSAVAEGDLRLAKLLPPLRKLGEAAPVFGRLADAVEALTATSATDRDAAAERLLELAALLSAVLHTQGKTETPGDAVPVQGAGLALTTEVPYRRLNPLLTALTTKGPGRLEQLRQAHEDGSFMDLRALPALCGALDDSFAEIPDYIERSLLPAFGGQGVPVLRSQYDPQGGKGHARRLQLLAELLGASAPDEAQALLLDAADHGSAEVKMAAVALLGAYPEQEPLVLAMSREKRKEVRSAAYCALAGLATERALDRLFEAATSKDRELAIAPVRQCGAAALLERIVAESERTLGRLEAAEAGSDARAEAAAQLLNDLRCLEGVADRVAASALPWLGRLLESPAFVAPDTETAQEAAAELLLALGTPEAYRYATELRTAHKGKFIGVSFRAAFKVLKPAELFDRYAGSLSGRSAAAKELQRAILTTAAEASADAAGDPDEAAFEPSAWDARWLKTFIEHGLTAHVRLFAQSGDKSAVRYLVAKLPDETRPNDAEALATLAALLRLGSEEAPELVIRMLGGAGWRTLYYVHPQLAKMLAAMPVSYAVRLRSFAEQLHYESVKRDALVIVDALEASVEEKIAQSKGGLWGWIRNRLY